MARVVGFTRLQGLYRRFVGLDLDKAKADYVIDVAEKKLGDLFEVAAERARRESRDTIHWNDLPVTKGLAATMERYERERERLADPRLDLSPILDFLKMPIGGLKLDEEVREKLPSLVATILLLIGYIVKYVDPGSRKPSKTDLERAAKILDLTL